MIKKYLKLFLKWFALLLVMISLAVAFSFLEKGELAKEISFSLNLPSKAMWQEETPTSTDVRESANQWEFLSNPSEIIPELKEPSKRIKLMNGQVIGTLEAKEVRIYQDAQVGSIMAKEMAAIYGGTVTQDVKGSQVILAPDMRAEHERNPNYDFDPEIENRNRGIVYGNLIGEDIQTFVGTTIMGNAGSQESRLDLAGTIQGNVTGKQIILRSTATIHGNVITSTESVVMEPGANVLGKIINTENKAIKIVKAEPSGDNLFHYNTPNRYNGPERIVVQDDNISFLFLLWLPVLLGILATLFITYGFFTGDAAISMENVTLRPLKTLWSGFVSAALGIPLVFLLFITIIGIPISIALAITLVLAALVGMSGVCLKIGHKVSSTFDLKQFPQVKEMLLGILLVAHLVWIPLLGWLVLLVLGIMGLGSVTMIWYPRFKDRWSLWRQSRKQKKEDSTTEKQSEETPINIDCGDVKSE
ncbi:polymer-forming cytoskeletal protein [Desulforamulus aeronauticus]|uniref:DUF8173 domain-containing protein n=1 Tax=Desulforamulus aeronauticus DSM 10349 TaxID=1121421 RepID=A0A1M6UWN1_9FIRM|nr:polymer-forming cytoskeletal protein [Desulforamulus aeronauticus]SHK73561.1 hypothetical protein SAMN02745123_02946 [Desulforamulus aeronauticus DSM 10349]